MTCTKCQHQICKKFGYFGKRRIQRWALHFLPIYLL
jgi:hypothetical protein